MKVKDIMSKKLVVCELGSSLDTVSRLMRENDVGFILIMNKNKLYGVITDRDLAINMGISLKDICKLDVVSIDENKDLGSALDVMREYKIKRLVVTRGNKIVGVLSLSDIINFIGGYSFASPI